MGHHRGDRIVFILSSRPVYANSDLPVIEIRDRIEDLFTHVGLAVYRWRFATLFLSCCVAALLSAPRSDLTVDTSNDAFYRPDGPVRVV